MMTASAQAYTESWGPMNQCVYDYYLSRCCNNGFMQYFADGAADNCHFGLETGCKSLGNSNTVYFFKTDFNQEMASKGLSPMCPTKEIYRDSGSQPITQIGHYEFGKLIEGGDKNTVETNRIINAAEIDHQTGSSYSLKIVKQPESEPTIKPQITVQETDKPSENKVADIKITAPTRDQILAQINAIMQMIKVLQAQLAGIK